MEAEATIGGDDPTFDDLLEVLREEQARLRELEALARSSVELPPGWRWCARLRIAVTAGAWVFRSSVLPEPIDEVAPAGP